MVNTQTTENTQTTLNGKYTNDAFAKQNPTRQDELFQGIG